MKVNFLLKGKNNPTNINCRFKPNQQNDFTCATGLWIHREEWNTKNQQVKQKATTTNKDLINSKLKELEVKIIDKWNNDYITREIITKNWLKDVVSEFFGFVRNSDDHKVFFADWIKKFIEESDSRLNDGKVISKRTIQRYMLTLSKIEEYEAIKGGKLRFEHIDLKFYRGFVKYYKDLGNKNNTIGSYISHIKMWCKDIELEGLPINPQYKHRDFKAISNETSDPYLTEEEINRVFDYNFLDNFRLSNVRDLFIIGLRTGLRVSDFLRLKKINFDDDSISVKTVKTGAFVTIPLHKQIKIILSRNNGKLPNMISDQKFNKYVKEVCELVGLDEEFQGSRSMKVVVKEATPTTAEVTKMRKVDGFYPKYELISSHTCRRSFASNLYGKLPNMTIMAITTHKTESEFLKYIKITKSEHAEALRKYWEEQ